MYTVKLASIELSGKYVTLFRVGYGSHGYSASFSCLKLFPHLYLLVKIQNSFYACVEEERSASLTIAREKQT